MAISYDYYRIFYYAGKYGSFTRAAKILMNSQPNINRSMNILEAELGCKLFYRSRKGVSLTPEGEKLFAYAETAVKQLQLGESEIASGRSLQSGHVSVAISEIALHVYMLPILQKYQEAHPGIHMEIANYSTTQGIEAVRRGLVDLAVVSTPTGSIKTLRETKIKPFQDILIAGKQYAQLSASPVSLRDLAEYPLICLGKDTKTYAFYNNLFVENDLVLDVDIEAATTDQVLPMVKYGIGIGFVPVEFAEDAIAKGEVFAVQLKEEIPERHICLVRDPSRPPSIAATAFCNMIEDSIENGS